MTKEPIIIIRKDNLPLPILTLALEPEDEKIIHSGYQSVENFLKILVIAEVETAAKIMDELKLSANTKEQLYKFFIKRDFEMQKFSINNSDENNNNSSKNSADIYQQISKQVFGDNLILKQLFHWARVNDLEKIKEFVENQDINNAMSHFNLNHPQTPEMQPIFLAAYYGYTELFNYLFYNQLYSQANADFRAEVLTAAAAGGHFGIFQTMFKNFSHQFMTYREIANTGTLQDNEFTMFFSLYFLLVAIGKGKLDFVTQFTKLMNETKVVEVGLFEKYSKRILSLITENTTSWPELGVVLTAKTAALHSGSMNMITALKDYSWLQQLTDICTFLKGKTFEDTFPNLTFEAKPFSALEKALFLVCREALKAITEKFDQKEIQQSFLKEILDAYKQVGYLHLFQMAVDEVLKQHKDCVNAQYFNSLFAPFLSEEKENDNENKENVCPNKQKRDVTSIKTLNQTQIGQFSPKKQKVEEKDKKELAIEEELESEEKLPSSPTLNCTYISDNE